MSQTMSHKRSIGPMTIHEPEDKSYNKYVITDGQGDVTPNDGSTCSVYLGLIDPIDIEDCDLGCYKLNNLHETTELTIGEGDTPLAELLDKIVMTMTEKEACYVKLNIDAKGDKLQEPIVKIQQLKFNIILQSFNRCADVDELEVDEKLDRAQHHKDKGTALFKLNRLVFAVKRYKKALSILQTIKDISEALESQQNQLQLLKLQCYSNLGAAYLKYEKFDDALHVCSRALELDEKNVKALFRRGQSYVKLHKYNEAASDFQSVLNLEPDNKAAQNQLSALQATRHKEKQIYKNMFN